MAYRLSTAAQFDLFKIALDGLEQFGPSQVARYEAGLQKTLERLSRNPRLATEHQEYSPPVRTFPFRAHVIIYRIEEDEIFVIRICNAREDWTRFEA